MITPRHPFRAGFTLVELLVAIVVLSLIVIAIGQIVSTATALTTLNNKHMDANSQARMVFDRMANDFARMVKRNDVDYIFFKASSATSGQGANDTMFFFTEGAGYYDAASTSGWKVPSSTYPSEPKNSVSLVGYRINNGTSYNGTPSSDPSYYQMERLGKALSWDSTASINPMVYLTYPPAGTDAASVDGNQGFPTYSTAFMPSTICGAYSNSTDGTVGGSSTSPPQSLVGSLTGSFNDGTDSVQTTSGYYVNPYHVVGSQVFRFEYSFQLKDGTWSDKPVMGAATSSNANGVPSANLTATAPPTSAAGSSTYAVGSRWYDTTNHIGYICVDATPSYAVWHEIGIQDIAAIIVTIAVIDKQGLAYIQKRPTISMATLSKQFPDYVSGNDPADFLSTTASTSWVKKLLPSGSTASSFSTATKLPQSMVSQIRIYQRAFYINNL